MRISVPYGKTNMTAELPDGLKVQMVDIEPTVINLTEQEMLKSAMDNPIGTGRLRTMLVPDDTIVIVVNDQTRPGPNELIMAALMEELDSVGVPDQNVTVLFATGSHRAPTREEMIKIVGQRAFDRFKMVAHYCTHDDEMTYVGDTPQGMPLYVNEHAFKCSFLITTGLITQHHCAGYSGGRKSIVPGIAGLKTLKYHHSFPVYQYEPAMDYMKGNPFHEIAVAAARKANVRFIVNAIQDTHKNVIGFVAGDLEEAHEAGVELCRKYSLIEVEEAADILISGPGGFPKDIDLYQSQKALSVSELICKTPCIFIMVAECSDGFGEGYFREIMETYDDPDVIIDIYAREGFDVGINKAFNYARALKKGRVIVVTQTIPKKDIEKAHLEWAGTLQDAVDMAIAPGTNPVISVIPYASGICAHVKEKES